MIFSAISKEEQEMMDVYINSYSDSDRVVGLDYLMRIWDREKSKYLWDMFGHQLILEKEVYFKQGEDQIIENMNDMIYEGGPNLFYHAFMDLCKEIRYEKNSFECDRDYYSAKDLVSIEYLAQNIYDGATFNFPTPDANKPIKVSTGCKISKVLGKIAAAYDLPNYEDFRIGHSMALNQKALRGRLCLSIHPLDYMTMSDNDSDWSSCMSWEDNGCYRQGTVEMMNSPMVVVAYLRARDDMRIMRDYYWNNKKWRQLFIVTPEVITGVKGYPYRNENLTSEVLKWLRELATKANIGVYTEKIYEYDQGESFTIEETDFRVHPHFTTNLMYNDFYTNQLGYFAINLAELIDYDRLDIHYSGSSECMSCGEEDPEFESEGYLVGTCCLATYYCDCCGDSYNSDEEFIEVDGERLCPYCAENETETDTITGELHMGRYFPIFYLKLDESEYRTVDFQIYEDNIREDFLKEYFASITEVTYRWNSFYVINVNDITETGMLDVMNFDTKEEMINYYRKKSNTHPWGIDDGTCTKLY